MVISKELADYFKDVDWAPSDVAVGLVLLKRRQKQVREIEELEKIISSAGKMEESMQKMEECMRQSFSQITLEIDLDTESSHDQHCDYATQFEGSHDRITNLEDLRDLFTFADYANIAYRQEDVMKLAADHLIYTEQSNGMFESPYFLAVSTKLKSIVIAVRGTYSMSDILVDLTLELEELHDGDGPVDFI
jgi:hypothetical protein